MNWRLSLGIITLLLLMAFPIVVHADNGPHKGEYTNTTDACAQCHRAHRGQAPNLLKGGMGMLTGYRVEGQVDTRQMEMCFSCHGTSGQGADTNVEDGIYMNRGSEGKYGTPGAGLRGGGFVNALMDPDMDGQPSSAPVTSKHDVGLYNAVAWGLGSSGAGHPTVSTNRPTIQCSTCHNPHGFANADYYRVLWPDYNCRLCHDIHFLRSNQDTSLPNDETHRLAAALKAAIPDEPKKNYTITYDADGYRNVGYLDARISEWCAQCHTRYLASNSNHSGDAIFTYRHRTDTNDLTCLVCHVAHGTSATMGPISGNVELPDNTAGGGTNDARLLHVNNRGICVKCHPSP